MKKGTKRWHILLIYCAILFMMIGILGLKRIFIGQMEEKPVSASGQYSKHFALITGDSNEQFWSQVYESAKAKAAENDAYVEWFGKNLSVSYSVTDFAAMAINAGVDGIILQASEDDETKQVVNKAAEAGIPLVTVLSDCPDSSRQAFVGVNDYDVGQLYGEKLVNLIRSQFKKNIKIMVAVGGDKLTNDQEQILYSVRQYLNANLPVGYYIEVTPQLIPLDTAYATEAFFNDMFVSSELLPHILICLDERGTKSSYQAAVDHNRVGETVIIGYYFSKDILSALEKEIVDSVLYVNAEEMGNDAVAALLDYQEYGYTNNYVAVGVELIGRKEAVEILRKESVDPVEEEEG